MSKPVCIIKSFCGVGVSSGFTGIVSKCFWISSCVPGMFFNAAWAKRLKFTREPMRGRNPSW